MLSTVAIGLAVAWAAVGSVPALAGVDRPAKAADQVRQQEWWLSALHVTQAWQTTKGAGVTIALLDTGVDPSHPDLAGSVISGPDLTNSGEKLGGKFFGTHGTAVASLIVGHGHGPDGVDGVVGVAPQAKLLSVRVALDAGDPLLSESSVTSGLPGAIAAGIRYAVSNGAQVIDLPLDPGQSISALTATPAPTAPSFTTPTAAEAAAAAAAGGSSAEQSAVAYALSKGVILVAPGGDNHAANDAANFPAAYPGVISVGAFNSSFIKAPFSSHQPYVTLTAAGSGMIAAVPPASYATVSSTSAASAVVTGIAALIKSQYPELTPAQVSQVLQRSTVFRPAGGSQDGSGAGTADAAKALAEAAVIASPAPPRAGAGAVANPLPAAPAPPVISDALTSKLYRDGLISLIVLVVLLIPTLAYAAMVRRRIRAIAQARAELSPVTSRVPYAHNAASDVDLMNEYFAPVPADPDSPGAADLDAVAVAGGPAGALMAARSLMSATRLAFPRHRPPEVAGTPPWEPAPEPDGELPWAGRSVPSRSHWNAPAHPIPAPTARAAAPDQAATPAELATGTEDATPPGPEAAARLYVWNPDSTTGNVPAVRGGDDSSPDHGEEFYGGPDGEAGTSPGADAGYYSGDAGEYRDDGEPSYSDEGTGSHPQEDVGRYDDGDPLANRDERAFRSSEMPAYDDPGYGSSSAMPGDQGPGTPDSEF